MINDENNTNYGEDKNTGANTPDTIKYDTRVLKPSLCDYAEAYILVDGTIRGTEGNNNTKLALKNCAPVIKCNLEINDEHVDTAENLDIVMPCNLFRSLEMPLINCKIKLYLTWKKECVLSTDVGNAVFIINDTKMYVPVVTLSKEDNKDFIEQQNKGFQRSIYWNEYKTKEINENADANVFKYINLEPSFQGVNRLFFMAYNRANGQPTRNGQQKYYLPRIDLEIYNVIIDRRNFYDNQIESDIEKYRELKKVMIGKGEDYTTGSLLDYNYFDKHYKLVAVDLSKQKELDADPRVIQQIELKCMLATNSTIYWVLEKSKETILDFYKGTVKVY